MRRLGWETAENSGTGVESVPRRGGTSGQKKEWLEASLLGSLHQKGQKLCGCLFPTQRPAMPGEFQFCPTAGPGRSALQAPRPGPGTARRPEAWDRREGAFHLLSPPEEAASSQDRGQQHPLQLWQGLWRPAGVQGWPTRASLSCPRGSGLEAAEGGASVATPHGRRIPQCGCEGLGLRLQ